MLSSLLLCSLLCPGLGPQDGDQDPVLPRITDDSQEVPLGTESLQLERGEIPTGTSDLARQRFEKLSCSTWTGDTAPARLHSFMVTFDARVRAISSGSNDLRTTFLYLEEGRGYVRGIFPKSRRESVRGPEGDWLLDGEELLDLSDHSNLESRREHQRWLALARNFATLASPGNLRLGHLQTAQVEGQGRELKIGQALPIQFPSSGHAKRARQLDWLQLTTPDFDLLASKGSRTALRQVRLGLDPKNGLVRFALIEALEANTPQAAAPILVEIPSWITIDQRLLPKQLLVHRSPATEKPEDPGLPVPKPTRLTFEELPGVDLFLVMDQTKMDVNLSAADFARPGPR